MTSFEKSFLSGHEIREKFLNYFKRHGHAIVGSSRLIPEDDDTLLFANAGMNQFKNLFLGLEKRNYARATTSQKCVRAGGKHNDLENVGFTARHHTFFEMLGNFSFGDYFKKEAIHFAWELLTQEMGIPKERLSVTVFKNDDEAADIWHNQEKVPRESISRFDEADNFWRMGDVGPCGPCTEIFFDHGPAAGCGKPDCKVGCSCDRFVEIWNLVFMQFSEDGKGPMKPLPKPSVDTGGGLERWAAVLQHCPNNYDTDFFTNIIQTAEQISKIKYIRGSQFKTNVERENTAAMRVLADHARASAFLIADGVIPSNEGRGYVLRRIMRRAIRYGRTLSKTDSLLKPMVGAVIQTMGSHYQELVTQKDLLLQTIEREETRFLQTLDQGTEILQNELEKLSSRGIKKVDGDLVFKLYDTFGFPVDLTRLMATEKGFLVDEKEFESRMEAARKQSQASWKGKAITSNEAHMIELAQGAAPTVFTGYGVDTPSGQKYLRGNGTQDSCKVLKLSNGDSIAKSLKAGDRGIVILERTPFYAESGGQVGDEGYLEILGKTKIKVENCIKKNDVHLHLVYVEAGELHSNDLVTAQVTEPQRQDTAANHSATHLLHSALRQVLGTHVTQAGSHVNFERLRFDFTHEGPLTSDEVEKIENLVNNEILKKNSVSCKDMALKDALQSGAMSLFGEKYGDFVRVVKMGDFSTELCGGTHVGNTRDISVFKIVSEGGLSSGVRRIEALTGSLGQEYLKKNLDENQSLRAAVVPPMNSISAGGDLQKMLTATREHLEVRRLLNMSNSWTHILERDLKDGGSYQSTARAIESLKNGLAEKRRQINSSARESSQPKSWSRVTDFVQWLLEELKWTEKEIKKSQSANIDITELMKNRKTFPGGEVVTVSIELEDRDVLSQLADKLKDQVKSGVVVLLGRGEKTHPLFVSVSKDLNGKFSAGKILQEMAAVMGGKGGGRPDFAQGAVGDTSQWAQATQKLYGILGAS